jgi:hypothetical protein
MLSPETSTTRPAAVARLVASLEAAVGRERVLTGADVLAGYTTDWTRRYRGPAACAVRPRDTAEVAAVIRACARCRAVIVPQGGNTSLAGGSVPPPQPDPARPCVILSTGRLTGLGPVDALTGQLTAGAGVTIGALAGQAAAAGFRYGVDLASRDSATVGGTIATNAGGMRTIRYGPTRAQLLGVQVVLADGSVLSRLAGLPAESAGYDLTGLMAGSEGTLGVITAARLRLWPAEERGPVILAGVAGIDEAASLYAQLRDRAGGLRAAEYFEATAADLVSRLTGGRPPGPPRPATCSPSCPPRPAPRTGQRNCRGWPGPRSPPTRPGGTGCSAGGNGSPRRSARPGSRTRSTSRSRWPGSAPSGPASTPPPATPPARVPWSPCSATWVPGTCTSTSSARIPVTTRLTRR